LFSSSFIFLFLFLSFKIILPVSKLAGRDDILAGKGTLGGGWSAAWKISYC